MIGYSKEFIDLLSERGGEGIRKMVDLGVWPDPELGAEARRYVNEATILSDPELKKRIDDRDLDYIEDHIEKFRPEGLSASKWVAYRTAILEVVEAYRPKVGQCVQNFLYKIGLPPRKGCSCKALRRRMNRRGPEWIVENMDDIIMEMLENAREYPALKLIPGKKLAIKKIILNCIARSKK